MIIYKNRWELQTSVYLLQEKNHQQRNHQRVKTQVQQESPHKHERETLEYPDKEIKETTSLNPIELLPEVHPTKTASKAKHQEAQKQTKRTT